MIGLLRYQVLPYEWKENSGASFRARATLNKKDRRLDRYEHEIYHFQCFLIRLCEIVIKKLSSTEYEFLFPHWHQVSFHQIESSRNVGFLLCIRNLFSLRVMLSFARVFTCEVMFLFSFQHFQRPLLPL